MGQNSIEGSNPSLSATFKYTILSAPVVQLDRIPGYELGGREFESLRAHPTIKLMLVLPPLSLYIHFPWCIKKCPYCDFNSHTLRKPLPEEAYIEALLRDLSQELHWIQERSVISLYLGGGTPSLFSGAAIDYLLMQIKKKVRLAPNVEITLEANPSTFESQKFKDYYKAGVNRLSIGVQSFNNQSLKSLGRLHTGKEAINAVKIASDAGFTNFNVDLMYGLPNQTIEEGLEDLKEALKINPVHLSWYQLTLEPHTVFFNKPPILPPDDKIFNMERQGVALLKQHGFNHYEISAFSRNMCYSRHNENYWKFGDYLGIGAGAHGKITNIQKQKIIRYWKRPHPVTYLACRDNFEGGNTVLASEQLPFEFMLNALRFYEPILLSAFTDRTGLPASTLIPKLQKASSMGLLKWKEDIISVTSLGRKFYNNLVELFL